MDINIVDRSGRVYPTSRQTGAEFVELIHTASTQFARVAYYVEAIIPALDFPFLSSAVAGWRNGVGARRDAPS